jgi:hypothetical protein
MIAKIATELKAPFVTLDRGTFFDYPGKGAPEIKWVIKRQITELADFRAKWNKATDNSPELRKAFKDAFTKIQDWLNDPKHGDILANLKQDKVLDSTNSPTYADVLKKLAAGDLP